MTAHKQTWVKINTQVDRGIAELITVLSNFPKLQTIESCEDRQGWAWVCFIYGDEDPTSWNELAEFVLGFLGARLAQELGDRVDISIRVTSSGMVRAEMAVKSEAISATVKVLKGLQNKGKIAA